MEYSDNKYELKMFEELLKLCFELVVYVPCGLVYLWSKLSGWH
jgi:hypothetical protein